MARMKASVVQLGDRVHFSNRDRTVVGLEGSAVRLVTDAGQVCVVMLSHLVNSAGFYLVEDGSRRKIPPLAVLEGLPDDVVAKALEWERHLIEIDAGVPAGASRKVPGRPAYRPKRRSLAERIEAKAAELEVSAATVARMRSRYKKLGLWGLVDMRKARPTSPFGRADPRLVSAIAQAVDEQVPASTGTRGRLRRRVEQILAEQHGEGVVAMPSLPTYYRLVKAVSEGHHTFGSAATRRSLANRPDRPFTATMAARPGEQVQIDATPLDVMAVLDDGVLGRVELTAAIDVATRTLCAGLLRPAGTKAVDAAAVLARVLVPEPMRPGWAQALAFHHARIPFERLMAIDARLEHAAAKPVIVPDTIVCDRGSVFMSRTFFSACQALGVSVQPAHPGTPTDKALIERTFASINTLFCQHVAGYLGPNVTRRGTEVDPSACFTVAELQELFDEWVIAGWQPRPHQGLRNPLLPEQVLSPNEMYAALVASAGFLPVPLGAEDFLELLPAVWRTVNEYGISVDRRTYDSAGLNPLRRQPSGITAQGDRWEVHYDPYDVTQVWVRDHRAGAWVQATWTHLPMIGQPFAEFTWRQARAIVAERRGDDTDQVQIAAALSDLLNRAGTGSARDRRAAARQVSAPSLVPGPPLRPPGQDDEPAPNGASGPVVPFGVFDPADES
ncbi:transposase InsO family protein [Catenulispora sp. GP43]|uniref:Mu transposase C-terminal domain-containing protein n=1 Tax=Catenulispora sp. GP43 TaxID=3156263 RepID=UPI003511DABF